MELKKHCFITTPIFYPSGNPHIGHAFTAILGDFLKRFKIQRGYKVFLLTGTDEHGKKIAEKSKLNNIEPQVFVDQHSQIFKNLFNDLQISYDAFVRTTNQEHEAAVKEIFKTLVSKNLIYFDAWNGWYCVECEENYLQTNAQIREDGSFTCAIGHSLIKINENSYFVKVNMYENWIKETLLQNKMNIYPTSRINELVNNFLNVGLKNLSITRESISWGIQVPENNKHTIYVWFDALFSYLTGLNFLSENDQLFQEFWNNKTSEKIHLLSKEITRFHCIYWPIFLKMLDLELPTSFLSHGWIVDESGNKMSKSLNNVIDPKNWINKYGNDAIRYYLLKEMSLDQDNRCGENLLINVYNADLANNLGNLVSRTIGMLMKYQTGKIFPHGVFDKEEMLILKKIQTLPLKWEKYIEENKIKLAFDECLKVVYSINKLIENKKPWELFKLNLKEQIANILFLAAAAIRVIFVLLEPVLINKANIVFKQMNFDASMTTVASLANIDLINNVEISKDEALKSEPLFVRIVLK